MNGLEELEMIVGSISSIKPFGLEPDICSLGIEPAEILGFETEEQLEFELLTLMADRK